MVCRRRRVSSGRLSLRIDSLPSGAAMVARPELLPWIFCSPVFRLGFVANPGAAQTNLARAIGVGFAVNRGFAARPGPWNCRSRIIPLSRVSDSSFGWPDHLFFRMDDA